MKNKQTHRRQEQRVIRKSRESPTTFDDAKETARSSQEQPGSSERAARISLEQPGAASNQEQPGNDQEQPGVAGSKYKQAEMARSSEEQAGAGKSSDEPGAARSRQKQPGEARSSQKQFGSQKYHISFLCRYGFQASRVSCGFLRLEIIRRSQKQCKATKTMSSSRKQGRPGATKHQRV